MTSSLMLSIPELEPGTDVLTAALGYAAAGLYVLPIKRGSKHPGSVVGARWQHRSSRDPEVITSWLAGTDHGIAIHLGRSGAVAFDIDDPEKVPDVLRSAIAAAPFQSSRPDVPGKGHALFTQPAGRMLGNGTGRLGGAWGEVRGRNGVIVVWPTPHPDGGRYAWERTGVLPVLPNEVADLLDDASPAADSATDAEVVAALSQWASNRRPELLDIREKAFAKKVAAGESRHQQMVLVLVGALKEAAAGYYPAAVATQRLEAAFVEAVSRPPVGSRQRQPRAGAFARAEYAGIVAWAVGQARAADPRDTRRRVNAKVSDEAAWDADDPRATGWEAWDEAKWRHQEQANGHGANGHRAAGTATDEDADDGSAERPALEFLTFRELAAKVKAAGRRPYLLRGIWPAGDYGVHAAEMKAQKTWNTADLAVSVASGTPWLGTVPVDDPGPVLMFFGEGGEANVVRRVRAIAEARDVVAEELPIVVCTRAPHLSRAEHLRLFAAKVQELRPKLVTLDPLYLAAGGADLADLYEMGALLEAPQRICQSVGAALFVVTHFNRKQGRGSARITGAGPAEWGRVLISATVIARSTDPITRETSVLAELDIVGGEVPDRTLRVRRRICADDPDDLGSPLHVETTVSEADEPAPGGDDGAPRVTPAMDKLLEALRSLGGQRTSSELVDWIARRYGHGLTRQTVSKSLHELARLKVVDGAETGPFQASLWWLIDADEAGAA